MGNEGDVGWQDKSEVTTRGGYIRDQRQTQSKQNCDSLSDCHRLYDGFGPDAGKMREQHRSKIILASKTWD
jgi:hypothetical protein